MGPRIRPGTRLWLGGLAAGGVAVAHLVAFLLVAPDPFRRQRLLESTGHGAWPLIVSLAMGALVVGLAGLAARPPARPGWRARGHVLGRLLLLQMTGFLLLEVVERLGTGKGLTAVGELSSEPVIIIGLAAQLVSALVAVLLLSFLDRIIVTLVELFRVRARAPRTLPSGLVDRQLPVRMFATVPANPRGPPRRI